MGRLKIYSKFTTGMEVFLCLVVLAVAGFGLFKYAPGLFVKESQMVEVITMDGVNVDNISQTEKLELPSNSVSSKVSNEVPFAIAGYPWTGNTAIMAATGGSKTMKGSLMEKNKVNFQFFRQDNVDNLRQFQVNFAKSMSDGKAVVSATSVPAVTIMGDGAPFYIATTQKALNEAFGEGKYHVEAIAPVGISYGEDKLIAPIEWKANPNLALGSLISVVVGDGDWVVVLNWAAAQGFKINPDLSTYDAQAINFTNSEDNDFMKSAEELINHKEIKLKVVKDGKLTGGSITKKVDACGTWFPGDKRVFDAMSGYTDIVSTKDFNNQMPTTVIIVREWAAKNPAVINNFLSATYTAANQVKLFDEWRVKAAEALAATFGMGDTKYWYDAFKGVKGEKNGVKFSVGGSRVFNYADAMQYYGIGGDGVNRYKSVYEQVGKYLTTLDPFGFKTAVQGVGVVAFEKAVNPYYLKSINNIESGAVYTTDYQETATEVVTSGNFNINFAVGSAEILSSSYSDLDRIYNLLIQAESTKISLEGHTDSTGNPELNKNLSEQRAKSVKDFLIRKGVNSSRVQEVVGYGAEKPIASNATANGKAQNRRVVVTMLK